MSEWTPEQWLAFAGGMVTLIGTLAATITTVILQLRGNAKTAEAKAISVDNNAKVTAVVAQTREIARAVDGASTAPTDVVIQRGAATTGAQRSTDPAS